MFGVRLLESGATRIFGFARQIRKLSIFTESFNTFPALFFVISKKLEASFQSWSGILRRRETPFCAHILCILLNVQYLCQEKHRKVERSLSHIEAKYSSIIDYQNSKVLAPILLSLPFLSFNY